jgi:modulator of FtsH protease
LVIVHALATTAAVFLTLSGYALISKKDFSFLGGFLSVGLWVLIGAILFSWVGSLFGVQISGLHLAISSMAVLLFSGFILFDTHRILSGGERNYVLATVSLYLSIYNLFIHLLALFGFADD